MLRGNRKILEKIKSIRKNKTKKGENLKMEDLLQYFQTVYSNVETEDTQAETQNNLFTENMLDPGLDSDRSLEELKRSVFHQKKIMLHTDLTSLFRGH